MIYDVLPAVEHPGVRLRALRAGDLQAWFDILSQPRVHEHTSWSLASVDDLRQYARQTRESDSLARFAIARLDDDTLIGSAGFHTVSTANRTAEIAYDLGPEYWGRGIARATCNALVAWAFERQGLVRVQGTTVVSNARSVRVLEACGFEREGLLRRYRMVRGSPRDFWLYSRLA